MHTQVVLRVWMQIPIPELITFKLIIFDGIEQMNKDTEAWPQSFFISRMNQILLSNAGFNQQLQFGDTVNLKRCW